MLSFIEVWEERIMDTTNRDNFLHLLFLTPKLQNVRPCHGGRITLEAP